MTWKLEHEEGEVWFDAGGEKITHTETRHVRLLRYAGLTNDCDGGAYVEQGKNYNGSGPQEFGGVDEWPHVKVSVSLPYGRYDLRAELACRLRATIDRFVDAHPEMGRADREGK